MKAVRIVTLSSSRRLYRSLLVGLTVCCSMFYLLLYYCAANATSSSSSSALFCPSVSFQPFVHAGSQTRLSPPRTLEDICGDGGDGGNRNGSSGFRSDVPLLTLFSTWVNRDDLKLVRKLTLRNWAQLRPLVRPVLFSNDSVMVEQARQSGWETLPVSKMAIDVPILKNMYLDAMSRFNSTLYAFANGDILFTNGLLDSLMAILRDPAPSMHMQPLLVIGQRTNVKGVMDEDALTFRNVSQVARKRGKLFIDLSEDFFITDRSFPWAGMPEVVIGRMIYDNWLVQQAIQKHYKVVDITKTSPAVHQTTDKGNFEGSTHSNSMYNYDVLKSLYKKVQYLTGSVTCAPWRTLFNSECKVVVENRAKRSYKCPW